MLSLGIPDGAV